MAQDGTANLFIFGEINRWWGFNKDKVIPLLRNNRYSSIDVYIASPGGDLPEAIQIHDLLKGNRATVNVYLLGECASAATVIACAGDRVVMSQQCVYMIHDPMFGNTGGNARELRSDADRLDMYGDIIIGIYERKTGASPDMLREMMAAETWMNAETALINGFVDEVAEEIAIDWGISSFGAIGGDDYWFMDYLYDCAQNSASQAAPVAYTGQETYRKAVLNFINKGLQPAMPGHASQTKTIMNFITKITDLLISSGLISAENRERANEAISGIDLVEAVRDSAGQVTPEQIRAAITAMSEDDRRTIFPIAVAAPATEAEPAANALADELRASINDLRTQVEQMAKDIPAMRAKLPTPTGNGPSPVPAATTEAQPAATDEQIQMLRGFVANGKMSRSNFKAVTGIDYQ